MVTKERREYFFKFTCPIDQDPIDPAMDKKLVINVAPTGAFIKRSQNPNQPYTPDELVRHVVSSYKEGASVWHVHIRDAEGVVDTDRKTILEALDRVLDECPGMLFSHSSHGGGAKTGADMGKFLVEPLLEAGQKRGRRYIHTMVIAPYQRGYQMNEQMLKDLVTYLQENGIQPEFQIHNYNSIRHVKDWLLRDGTLKGPCIMNLISGYHGFEFSGPTGTGSWDRIYLMSLMNLLPEGSVIGATIGGRGWLPLILEAITVGVDCIRIGMEDAIYMY
ncbi:MAG: 3-keto-5-aminohexanoate cleavage protein, partial [Desulfobacterales bacterium]|nr:3-keto-5-aminohexanoate cleavage protein [Desulfobacterales bacterium]